ncbi:MAG: peptidylprolyl isomerase [Clostridiaceae bacterium]|jgi:peptidyl-prolyl cis-trans isomerase B (cyclophilin B)|nr:peptidylprolyl isomerase [Clostridiaceae bacterium]
MKIKRKTPWFTAILLIVSLLLTIGCGSDKKTQVTVHDAVQTEGNQTDMSITVADGYEKIDQVTTFVNLQMDSGKHIVIELDPKNAPISVANFQKLVGESFYDEIIFHRVIAGFMIQGGDPEGTGRGGSKEQIKGEFASNGVDNRLSHERGVVSMARTPSPNSASSQFFICHGDSEFLDGDYAAFGRVIFGMDEVDRIATLQKDGNDFPAIPPVMERVFFVNPVS